MGTYVVSGSASGIGAALAQRLSDAGHRVIGVDRAGADVRADLASSDGRAAAVAGVLDKVGGGAIDGLVPCAGIAGLTGVDSEMVVSVNYFGAIALVDGLREAMAPESSVVMISSNSVTCMPGWPGAVAALCLAGDEVSARAEATEHEAVQIYPATKAAIAGWVRREAVARAQDGVRINAVAPGLIATAMTDALREDPVLGVFADAYPTALQRPGLAAEVAAVIDFLLSPAASLIVGSVIIIDGGTDAIVNPHPVVARGVSLGS
ncbi:MAG TPA: SDR family oxidoreductase [Marmoricola sp.]|nr:SDR family oxidoreductase [Marmoricola sp.]